MNKIKKLVCAMAVAGLSFAAASPALGADLTYSNDTYITITSPSATFTILATSVATSVVVNTGNIVVTVPASGVFYLDSTNLLQVTGQSYPGYATASCNGNHMSATVRASASGPETVTFAPVSGTCSGGGGGGGGGAPSGGGGGGGGGGGSTPPAATQPVTPPVTTTPAPQTPVTSPTGGLKFADLVAAHGNLSTPVAANSLTAFGGTLKVNAVSGVGILNLQKFLNSSGFTVAAKGPGSPGKETKLLGALTKAALKKFQKSVGLSPTGKLDKTTVQYLSQAGM